jgi:hypothetical protein
VTGLRTRVLWRIRPRVRKSRANSLRLRQRGEVREEGQEAEVYRYRGQVASLEGQVEVEEEEEAHDELIERPNTRCHA